MTGAQTPAIPAAHAHRARPTERANRLLLTITAFVLMAAGALVLLRSFGAFGHDAMHDVLLSDGSRRWVDDRASWLWPVAAGVCTLLALAALRWLLAQLRTDRPGNLDVVWTGDTGHTTIAAGAAADAVAAEVAGYEGVDSADARLVGAADHPELHLYLDVQDGTDL